MTYEPVDEFYYVETDSCWLCVSKNEGENIRVAAELNNKFVVFEDLTGKIQWMRTKNIIGMHWSTPEFRENERIHNDMIREEVEDHEKAKGWKEND